jgi:DNA-3-methyladenine glycosylase I
MSASSSPSRCTWCADRPLLVAYHDAEWGVPVHDDRLLFEMLTLEGAQAGLSWETVLKKREGYRRAFRDFDPHAVARFGDHDVERLLGDASIVRHRGKIAATLGNARAFLQVQREFGSFDAYIWGFVDRRSIDHRIGKPGEIPAKSPESDRISRDLQKRGFKFVGSTICYAFMQATGLVNDHQTSCFRHGALGSA